MTIAIISDSHIPTRADAIPETFREEIQAADHVIHAGDFETSAALQTVKDLAADLTAVHGNADPPAIGLPAVASLTVADVTFVVTHGTINPIEAATYPTDGVVMSDDEWRTAIADTARARTRAWTGEGLVGVGGHNHQVHDETHAGVRLLNPGSVTGVDPAEAATMMTVDPSGAEIAVTVHEA